VVGGGGGRCGREEEKRWRCERGEMRGRCGRGRGLGVGGPTPWRPCGANSAWLS
jgi:hypothetical protein